MTAFLALFTITGGTQLTSDDMFLSMEKPIHDAKVRELETEKQLRLSLEKYETAATEILLCKSQIKDLNSDDLTTLLLWHQIPKRNMGTRKAQKLALWTNIVDSKVSPPEYVKWLDEDEARLKNLKSKQLTIADTALGRFRSEKKRELEQTFKSMEQQERNEFLMKLQAINNAESV